MKQVMINVISSPRELIDNKIWVTCPICTATMFEFDLTSEHKEDNCRVCRSLIRVTG